MPVLSKFSSVYLVQPELVLGTNIYKFGINKGSGKRIKSYGKKTIVIREFQTECYEEIETILKIKFKKKFKLVKGKEYFEGNLQEMIKIFDKVCHMFGRFDSEELERDFQEEEKHRANFKNVLNDINTIYELGPYYRDDIHRHTTCYRITTFDEWLKIPGCWVKNIIIKRPKNKTGYVISKDDKMAPRELVPFTGYGNHEQEETLYELIEYWCWKGWDEEGSKWKFKIKNTTCFQEGHYKEMPMKEQINLIINDLLKQRIKRDIKKKIIKDCEDRIKKEHAKRYPVMSKEKFEKMREVKMIRKMSEFHLRNVCEQHSLKTNGNRDELVNRLLEKLKTMIGGCQF